VGEVKVGLLCGRGFSPDISGATDLVVAAEAAPTDVPTMVVLCGRAFRPDGDFRSLADFPHRWGR